MIEEAQREQYGSQSAATEAGKILRFCCCERLGDATDETGELAGMTEFEWK